MNRLIDYGLCLFASYQVGALIGQVSASLCFKCMKYNFHCDCRKLEMEQAQKRHDEYIAAQHQQILASRAETKELIRRYGVEQKERYNDFMEEHKNREK